MKQAVIYLALATFFYAVINSGVKLLAYIPASEVVVFRAAVTLIICLIFIHRKGLSPWGHNKKVLLWRGVFGTLALFSFFSCVQQVPLAVAMTLINLSPIFTVILAHVFLGEKATLPQWGLLILCFLGVFMVRGEVEPVPLFWMGVGLTSALFAAMAYTCVRVLRSSEDPLVVIFYFSVITVPAIGPVAAWQWHWPSLYELVILLGIGVLTQMAQYYMTVAYQLQAASRVMVFNYFGLFWGVLLGWLLFQETLTAVQITGVLLVFFCLCGNYYVSRRAFRIEAEGVK